MEKTRQGGLRILFADDEAHLRDLMQMELPRLGHEVTVCPDGASAMRALEKGSYDAALLDLRMPGMTGIEAAIATRQRMPNCKILLFSGQATTADLLEKARQEGHEFEILAKPVHPTDLLAKLRG